MTTFQNFSLKISTGWVARVVKPILETRNVSDVEISEMSVNLLKTGGNKMSFIPQFCSILMHTST